MPLEEWLESIDKVSERRKLLKRQKQLIYSLFILWKESSVKIEIKEKYYESQLVRASLLYTLVKWADYSFNSQKKIIMKPME